MSLRRVAQVGLDGSTVTMSFGKVEIRCIKASYGDKLEKAKLSEMGGQTIDAVSQGTYSTEDLKVTMTAYRFRTEFMAATPTTGGGNIKMPIVIGRSHPDAGSDSDLCEGCEYLGATQSVENSSKIEEVELTFLVKQLKLTDERKTINQTGSVAIGTSGF